MNFKINFQVELGSFLMIPNSLKAYITLFTSTKPFRLTNGAFVVATILFYYSIFVHPSMLMLYLSSVIFVPIIYEICIILWFPFESKVDILRFFLGLFIYLIFGSVINIMIGIYSLLNVDCFKWGKTRMLNNNEVEE